MLQVNYHARTYHLTPFSAVNVMYAITKVQVPENRENYSESEATFYSNLIRELQIKGWLIYFSDICFNAGVVQVSFQTKIFIKR